MSRLSPRVLILAGLGLCLLGLYLMQTTASVVIIQQSTSSAQFAQRAAEGGNGLRFSSLIDSIIYVPGYVLLFLGLVAKYDDPIATWVRRLLVTGAIADQIENVSLQLALGRADLDAGETIDPAGWLIVVLRIASTLKWLLLALMMLALLAVVIKTSRERMDSIRTSSSTN